MPIFDSLLMGMYDNGNSGTAATLNMSQSLQKLTLTGNVTLTLTAPNAPCAGALVLIQDGTGSRTITWPAAVTGIRTPYHNPTASSRTVLNWIWDGTNYDMTPSRLPMAIANVTEAAPTQAECVAAFGTAAAVGAGFMAMIQDNAADSAAVLVVSNGTSYYHEALTKGA